MAAPSQINVRNLKGNWIMDKNLSDDTDPVLKLQGVGWLVRKGIGMSTVNMEFIQSTEVDPETSKPFIQLIANQTAVGGSNVGTSETRIMDWMEREHSDFIFGDVTIRCRFVNGVRDSEGNIRPDIALETPGPNGEYLKEMVYAPGEDEDDDLSGLFIQDYIVKKTGSVAEQVWGFENICGQRCLTRRVLASKGSSYKMARVVYKFIP
ncbi:hypothetical protein BGW36DRAFT_53363 [Talaromyces proteolyticus]|uniref:Uncharacterized protein n=1 Tax=Talaromyces proteolyticus TaxID=1131652 RepID=A0AAD4KLW0_9EURO|nr:uncharacterized protein BGW36DRAFT_53363 [Talaromyces proteolyticus]KAH8691467.1 hypothetical protein BGW36DRAFT_53363 [Talaromyces proteolyticus]